VKIEIDDPLELLAAISRGRAQLVIRSQRLATCRACATELQETEEAIKVLRQFESDLKGELQ
jgi:hypothetical protein